MTLYLLRHGDAIEHGYADAERPLSKTGNEQAAIVGQFLKIARIPVDRIVSSPLMRAQQMANLVQGGMPSPACSVSDYLTPGTDHRQLINELNTYHTNSILLVGHEPQLRSFLSLLVTGGLHAHFAIRKGTLARVDIQPPIVPGGGSLKWLLTNEQMKAMLAGRF